MKTLAYLAALVCVIYYSIYAFNYPTAKNDGVFGEVVNFFTESETLYAKQYSHSGFDRIHPGMSTQEVVEVLGNPLEVWAPQTSVNEGTDNKEVIWWYSKSRTSSHHRFRSLMFSDDIVAEVNAYYYID